MSAGPDVNEMILGSEGTLGVVTEVRCVQSTLHAQCMFTYDVMLHGAICLKRK